MKNNPNKFKLYLLVYILCALLCMNGCLYSRKWNDAPPLLKETKEKVRQVDVIELSEVEEKTAEIENAVIDLPELTLSIEECLAFAFKNNLDLQVQLIEPSIEKENVIQAEAREFEPSFRSTAEYSKIDSPTASTIVASNVENSSVNLGLDIPLRTGGIISFDLWDRRNKTDLIHSTLNPSYNNDFTASISQPLLRNRGNRTHTHSIRLAQYQSRIEDARTKKKVIATIADVGDKYWHLYAARKNLDVRKQDLELKKALFEQAKDFVEVGEKAKIEIISTRAEMAASRLDLLKAEHDLRDKERELKQILNIKGLRMETDTVLIPSTPPNLAQYELDKEKIVNNALENRMDMLELELELARDSSKIEYQKNQILPAVDFTYKYNINGLGPDRGDAYDVLYEDDYNDHRFTLNISIPLGNKEAKSKLRQAIYERQKTLASKEKTEAEIKKAVLKQIDKVESSWQEILANRESTMRREEECKAKKRRYELGLEKSTDVLESQKRLADARKGEIDAIRDYQIALNDLAEAEGTIFSAANIEWEPVVQED